MPPRRQPLGIGLLDPEIRVPESNDQVRHDELLRAIQALGHFSMLQSEQLTRLESLLESLNARSPLDVHTAEATDLEPVALQLREIQQQLHGVLRVVGDVHTTKPVMQERWVWRKIGKVPDQVPAPLFHGTAPAGSAETDPVWTIRFWIYDGEDPTYKRVQHNVAWTERDGIW